MMNRSKLNYSVQARSLQMNSRIKPLTSLKEWSTLLWCHRNVLTRIWLHIQLITSLRCSHLLAVKPNFETIVIIILFYLFIINHEIKTRWVKKQGQGSWIEDWRSLLELSHIIKSVVCLGTRIAQERLGDATTGWAVWMCTPAIVKDLRCGRGKEETGADVQLSLWLA